MQMQDCGDAREGKEESIRALYICVLSRCHGLKTRF
jgi:hypothetical protein